MDALPEGIFEGSGGVRAWPAGLSAEEADAAARRAGRQCSLLDLTGVEDKAAFMERCARHLSLPEYFGRNWDALEECLTDPSWQAPAAGRVVLVRGWRGYAAARPGDWRIAEEIFAAAAAQTPLTVLLEGAGLEEATNDGGDGRSFGA